MINWKNASYCGASIYYFLISLVTPVITMHFIKLVDGSIFASINVMAIAMAAIVQTISTKEKVRKIIRDTLKEGLGQEKRYVATIDFYVWVNSD